LALFVPLIISSGGNSGSQAATLVIRAMALGEFQLRDWWRIVRREIFIGLGLGFILAVLGLMRILAADYFFHSYGDHAFLLSFVVALSLVGIVVWGTAIGSLLPFILKKFNFDPTHPRCLSRRSSMFWNCNLLLDRRPVLIPYL
jgi:magnesium transporter